MKRFYMIVEGQVQGVGFRYFTQLHAMRNQCTGWVRNMDNGMVEIQIQGEEHNIRNVLHSLKVGNHFIRVENIVQKEIAVIPNEHGFNYS